ncbi:hypothetical protein SDC9_09095 [bioreactor metagenome]|uniref:Uncharacterized protein n=1 Tax=bioreactor metagenome TaxID=1076179 RepID=A0A644TAF9_9ZZZZ
MGFKDLPGGKNDKKSSSSSSIEFSKEIAPNSKNKESSKSK